jgi:hypothetical protein
MDSGGGFQGRPPGPPERQQMLTEAGAAGDAASHQAQSSRPAVHAAPAASSAAGAAAALAVRKPVPLPTDGSEFVGGARKNSKKRKTEAPLNFYVGVLTAAQDRAFGTTSSMQAAEPGKFPRWLMFADPVGEPPASWYDGSGIILGCTKACCKLHSMNTDTMAFHDFDFAGGHAASVKKRGEKLEVEMWKAQDSKNKAALTKIGSWYVLLLLPGSLSLAVRTYLQTVVLLEPYLK